MAMTLIGLWVLLFGALACLPLLPAVHEDGPVGRALRRDRAWTAAAGNAVVLPGSAAPDWSSRPRRAA